MNRMTYDVLATVALAVPLAACVAEMDSDGDALDLPHAAAASVRVDPIGIAGPFTNVDADICLPEAGGFSLASTNPYFPIAPGRRWAFAAPAEDGMPHVATTIAVLDRTVGIAGVDTRVIVERHTVGGDLVLVVRRYVAEARDGTVCQLGQDLEVCDPDGVISREGSWRTGDGVLPGILMPANAQPGLAFRTARVPGVAEAVGRIVRREPVTVPAGTFDDALRIAHVDLLADTRAIVHVAPGVGVVMLDGQELLRYSP